MPKPKEIEWKLNTHFYVKKRNLLWTIKSSRACDTEKRSKKSNVQKHIYTNIDCIYANMTGHKLTHNSSPTDLCFTTHKRL